jgi:two-component system, chemotaxis family, protein-glutamate methylesterase/glutaminase
MTTETRRPAVELVVLLASAGGLNALSAVLHDLPASLEPPSSFNSTSAASRARCRRSWADRQHWVSWALDGQVVSPGQVIVCPPEMHMELTPDGSWWLRRMQTLGERRFDVLLASVANAQQSLGRTRH